MAFLGVSENFIAAAVGCELNIFDAKSLLLIKEISLGGQNVTEKSTVQTLCCAISKSEKFLAVATNEKRLFIWETHNWNGPKIITLSKQATSVKFVFYRNSEIALVADRSGSVVAVPTGSIPLNDFFGWTNESDSENESEANLKPIAILGHISMLLDIVVSPDEKFVITCDRDEKIRISNFPAVFDVQSMCMGHKEYVRSLAFFTPKEGPEILISASGDGTLKFWNYISAQCIYTKKITQIPENEEKNGAESRKDSRTLIGRIRKITCCSRDRIIALSFEQSPTVVEIYRICISDSGLTVENVEKIETVDFKNSIWDLEFGPEGKLWILNEFSVSNNEAKSPLTVWKFEENKLEFSLEKEIVLSDKFIEALKICKDELPLLPKMPGFGNFEAYQERKKEKIEKVAAKRQRML